MSLIHRYADAPPIPIPGGRPQRPMQAFPMNEWDCAEVRITSYTLIGLDLNFSFYELDRISTSWWVPHARGILLRPAGTTHGIVGLIHAALTSTLIVNDDVLALDTVSPIVGRLLEGAAHLSTRAKAEAPEALPPSSSFSPPPCKAAAARLRRRILSPFVSKWTDLAQTNIAIE